MAGRQFKQGLDYFPLDVDYFTNDKMQLIEAEYGINGTLVALRLLCKIYKNGYYYQWGEDESLLFAKGTSHELTPCTINEIVSGLVRREFFDPTNYAKYGILTSASIQSIYLEASGRRKSVAIISEYWLFDIPKDHNISIMTINANINAKNEPKNEQRKGKEIKEEIEIETEKKEETLPPPEVADKTCKKANSCTPTETIHYEQLVTHFNQETRCLFGMVRTPLNQVRKQQLTARIREFGKPTFHEMIRAVMRSDFLKGDNKRGFKATFDWMIKPSNYQKIIEGNYENKPNQPPTTHHATYTTIAERIQAESEQLKENLAAKYSPYPSLREQSPANDPFQSRSPNQSHAK